MIRQCSASSARLIAINITMRGSEKSDETFQHSRASQKVNAATAAAAVRLLKQTVYTASCYLFWALQKQQFRIQFNKMQQWLKLQLQADLENNVSQQDGPLPFKHNAMRLYLGKDFSQQQTGNGWPTHHWSRHSLSQAGHGINLALRRP
jgi:hypothetical protein